MTGRLALFALLLGGWSMFKAIRVVFEHAYGPEDDFIEILMRMPLDAHDRMTQHATNASLAMGLAQIILAASAAWH